MRPNIVRAIATVVLSVGACVAQNPGYVTASNNTGIPDAGTFMHSDIDSVNLQNGGLNVRIPFVSRKMRHFDYTAGLRFDSKMWVVDRYSAWQLPTTYSWRPDAVTGGWQITDSSAANIGWTEQEQDCPDDMTTDGWGNFVVAHQGGTLEILSNFVLTTGDGTKYQFPTRKVFQRYVPDPFNSCIQYYTKTDANVSVPYSANGEYLLETSGSWDSLNAKVTAKDGSWLNCPAIGRCQPWRDTNGNLSASLESNGWVYDNTGRQVGRWISGTPPPEFSAEQLFQYYDADGTLRTVTVDYVNISGTTTFPTGDTGGVIFFNNISATGDVVSRITLANGLQYNFHYGPNFFDLTQIDLPTGGYIKYSYGSIPQRDYIPPVWETICNPDDPIQLCYHPPSASALDARVLTGRIIGDGGGIGHEDSWTYEYTTATTKVTHHSNVTGQTDIQVHTFSDVTFSGKPVETEVEYQDANSVPLRRVDTDWAYDFGPTSSSANIPASDEGILWDGRNVHVIRTTTTLLDVSPALISKVETDFNDCFSYATPELGNQYYRFDCRENPTQVREYDYGTDVNSLILKRYRNTTYLHSASDVPDASTYDAAHIWDRVRLSQVVEPGTPDVVKAQTRNTYSSSVSGSYGDLDIAYHEAPAGPRANLVLSETWRNTDDAWLPTTNTYDHAGNLIATIDPGSHLTQFEYGYRWAGGNDCAVGTNSYAYVTATINALSQRTENTYYRCTGEVQARRDPNDLAVNRAGTTFTYDFLGRVLTQTLPYDTGTAPTTTYTYHDQPWPYVSIQQAASPSPDLYSHVYFDGLGRKIQTKLVDPEGDVTTEWTYDGTGKTITVSNPHRSSWSPADGITSTLYDALSRVITIVRQDDTESVRERVQTAYSGNCTAVTDETGRQRKSCSDALGRLTSVIEPNPDTGSLTTGAFTTLYTYDVLGNLTCAVQKGTDTTPFTSCAAAPSSWRPRSFTYDSLSRLLTANNPESGTITYSYAPDANCNPGGESLRTKTDLRGITTTFCYEPLHRISSKIYSGDGGVTAASYFLYDEPSVSGQALSNTIGRLSHSYSTNTATLYSYDSVGRVAKQWPCVQSWCALGNQPIQAEYDKAGHTVSLTYPSGRIVSRRYTAAGRLDQLHLAGSSPSYDYLNIPSSTDPDGWGYFPHGGLRRADYGNSTTDMAGYNSRLQLSAAETWLGATRLQSHSYNWLDGMGRNNGNVWSMFDNLDSNKTQNFDYDALNRIAHAWTTGPLWGNTYQIDAWGNLNKMIAYSDKPPVAWFDQSSDVKNRLVGWAYDEVGNLLAFGSTIFNYDGENRIRSIGTSGITYTYDADGNRVRKDVEGKDSTEYIYFGGQVLSERNVSTSGWTDYIYSDGKRIARATGSTSAGTTYYHSDHLGTTTLETDSSGSVVANCIYMPYGGQFGCSPDDTANHYRFTGKERDSETGLDYFGARYYGSTMGRFTSPDPKNRSAHVSNPQSWNRYAYTLNNPLKFIDPDGKDIRLAADQTPTQAKAVMSQLVDAYRHPNGRAILKAAAQSSIRVEFAGSSTLPSNRGATTGPVEDRVQKPMGQPANDGTSRVTSVAPETLTIRMDLNTNWPSDGPGNRTQTQATRHDLEHVDQWVTDPVRMLNQREDRTTDQIEGEAEAMRAKIDGQKPDMDDATARRDLEKLLQENKSDRRAVRETPR